MKTQIKQYIIFFTILTAIFASTITLAYCERRIYVERPQMGWYLDECGQWRQGYGGYEEYNDPSPSLPN